MGYKVNSERAVQFRKWATRVIEEFTIQAYVMDAERQQQAMAAPMPSSTSIWLAT